jgi:hypothetical protein
MTLKDVEMFAANWRKASGSVANGACVEVASTDARVLVRDSVDPAGPAVAYASRAWQDFVNLAKRGQLDSFR